MTWGEIAQAEQAPIDDEGVKSLLALLPEHKRVMGTPLIRGMLANIKAQLSGEDYALYCQSLKRAYEAHKAGDFHTAKQIIESYGLPYEMMVAALA